MVFKYIIVQEGQYYLTFSLALWENKVSCIKNCIQNHLSINNSL